MSSEPGRRPPDAEISVIECSIPEHLTIAAYRAERRRALASSRRGLRASPGPGTVVAAGSKRNRPKEVDMTAVPAGRSGRQLALAALAVAIVASLVLLAVGAEPSLAGSSQVGRNVGKEVETWAKAIMLGVAGLVAIPILAKRDVAGGFVMALLVILVGGFVFAPASVKDVISGLWRSIGG